MSTKKHTVDNHKKNYIVGFVLSVVLTLIAFYLVWQSVFEGSIFISSLVILAISQLYIQVRYFFNLESESKPKWHSMAFIFMMLIVLIVVLGSLWIMANLDYNMMPKEVETYIIEEEGIRP